MTVYRLRASAINAVSLFLLLFPTACFADTTVSSDITTDTVWTTVGSPYIVTADITIQAGVTLTIQSGVTVKANSLRGLYVYGTIIATETNFTRSGTTGYWKGIYLSPASGSSSFTNCQFSYGGAYNGGAGIGNFNGSSRQVMLYLDDCDPVISGCSFANAERNGVEMYSSRCTFQSNTISDVNASYYPLIYDTPDCFPVISGTTITGTGQKTIPLGGGVLSDTGTWRKVADGFPFLIGENLTVSEGQTLTLEPGVTIRWADRGLYVNGTLHAVGTETAPIVLTSDDATPAAGQWRGVYLGPTAGASQIAWLQISNAGSYSGGVGLGKFHDQNFITGLLVDSSHPSMESLTITLSGGVGLDLWACNSTLNNLTIDRTTRNGFRAQAGCRPTINTVSLTNTGTSNYYTGSMDFQSCPTVSNVTQSGNKMPGLQVYGGTLSTPATWQKWADGLPWIITADVTLSENTTWTVNPGVVIKSNAAVIYLLGTALCDGTSEPIIFTSYKDDSVAGDTNGDGATAPAGGNWVGIYVGPTAGASEFRNCTFRYAAAYNGGPGIGNYEGAPRFGTLFVHNSSPVFYGCTISNGDRGGIHLFGSQATIRNCSFANFSSAYYPILINSPNCAPIMEGNTTTGTGKNMAGHCGGAFPGDIRWYNPGPEFPYDVFTDVLSPEGSTWTIDAGTTVKTTRKFSVLGTLMAIGTPDNPITFTSSVASPVPGDWVGIYLGPQSSASVLEHINLLYGASYNGGPGIGNLHGSPRFASLYVDGSSPTLSNVSISSTYRNGLEMYAAQPTVNGLIIDKCGWHGVRAEGGSVVSYLNTVFRNSVATTYYPISCDGSSIPILVNPVFTDNKLNAVQLTNGTLALPATLKAIGTEVSYALTGDVIVSAVATLTIEPGSVVKGSSGAIHVLGSLIAENVVFTSIKDDSVGGDTNGNGTATSPGKGDWIGIYFGPDAGGSVFRWNKVAYAGGYNGGVGLGNYDGRYRQANVVIHRSSPRFACNNVFQSDEHGILTVYSNSRVVDCIVSDIRTDGILVDGGYPMVGNNLVRNSTNAIRISSGGAAVGNNIVTDCSRGVYRQSGVTGTVLNNLAWQCSTPGITNGVDGNLVADPQFTDPANGNYRPLPSSPCIDAGNSDFVRPEDTDILGWVRAAGACVDIGPYEYVNVDWDILAKAARALRIAAGINECSPEDLTSLNIENTGPSEYVVDMADVARWCRKANFRDP